MPDQEVKTVFTVADQQAQDRMKAMRAESDKLAAASEKAKAGVGGVAGKPATPEHGAAGGISAEERASIEEAKAERKLRRQRMLVQKVELQKEQVLHRAADAAMFAFMGKQNEMAEALAGKAALAQGLGTSMAAFGGTIGKVGGALASLGSAGAIASLALSAVGGVLGAFGIDLEEVGHEAKKFGAHLLGIKTKDDVARSMGYLSAADMQAARGMKEMWAAEAALTRQLNQHANDLPKWPAMETAAAMEELHAKSLELAKSMPGPMKLEEKVAKIEAAAKASLASSLERQSHEAALNAEISQNILPHLRALPAHATQEQMERLNIVIGGYVQSLLDDQKIIQADAAATAEAIRAKLAERDSVQNVVDQYRRNFQTQAVMDAEVKKQVKHLKVIPLTATAARLINFNDTLAKMAQHMAEVSHYTPEQTNEYLTKLREAATEKQQKVFDFRGSRFDIRQNFAEGFDPGRVSVGFVNDLAALGERRVQSGFAPLFGVR